MVRWKVTSTMPTAPNPAGQTPIVFVCTT
jgi:hypothetical protein